MLSRPGVPEGALQTQRAEDWCSQRRTLQTQMPNEATDGLAPSVLDSFSGAARAVSYEFPPASEEDPRRETLRFGLASCSRGLVLPQGDITGPKSRELVFPEGDIADPQRSNEATDGLAPSVFAIFRAQLERIFAFFRQRAKEDPRQDTTGSDSRRAPEAWCFRTGTLQTQIPTRLLTLLLNTPQIQWCYSGSPHPIFRRGPLRRLPWTTCHIFARSSI